MEVETIAVIGMGSVGREIAYYALLGGYRTVLEDVSAERVEQSVAWLVGSFEEGVLRSELAAGMRDAARALISTARSVEDAIRNADLLIEAVPDEMEMKLELFTLFDRFAKPGAILASGSRAFSIGEMTDVTTSQERCVGMRFCNTAGGEKAVEIVKTQVTSQETVVSCLEVARRMGRAAVIIEESSNPAAPQNPETPETTAAERKR